MPANSIKLRTLRRAIAAESIAVDRDARTATFSFSSEYPVDRYFGKEILSHTPGAADLSRMNDGGAFLWNHNTDDQRGVTESAEIKPDKRGYATVRFSKSPAGEELMNDMADGIKRNISFAYDPQEMKMVDPGDGNNVPPTYLVTKWLALEISSVSVPADPTIGVGRSESKTEYEVPIINQPPEERTMTPEPEKIVVDEKKVFADGQAAERARIAQITALGEKLKDGDLARQLVDGGKTIEEARHAFIEKMGLKQAPVTGKEGLVGLSEREIKGYSFLRMLRTQMDPQNAALREEAAFEREASLAAAKISGKTPQGMIIPIDVLRAKLAQRDLTVGTSTAGGDFVATDLLSASFIDLLRHKSALSRAGVTMMNGLVGDIAIPRQSGGATAYWVGEGSAPTESDQAINQVTLNPKSVAAMTKYSRKLLLQSSLDVEAFVRKDLAFVIALEIDRAGMYGSGSSGQPLGLKNVSGINTSSFAGATPTFAEIIGLESKIAADDADLGSMKYLLNATMRGNLKSAVKVTNQAQFIFEQDGTMNGYDAVVSNQLISGDVLFGNWADLIIGMWSGLDMVVDPYSASDTRQVRVTAFQDCDIAVRHPESFCRGNNSL